MPGKKCPECGEATFFGKYCTNCGLTMKLSPNEGKGGRGKKCPNCNKFTVYKGECTTCGAVFTKQ